MSGIGGRVPPAQMREHLRMYLVVGSVNCRRQAPLAVVREAIAGGATMVQFREKGTGALAGEPMRALALELQAACRAAGVPFIVDDDVELALAIGADGVHVGQDDADAGTVRERIGDRILGVSAHTEAEARIAVGHGADYLGIGPLYPTASKEDAHAVHGLDILQELRQRGIVLPLVGIGGITAERAPEVIRAGAAGVAVISAVTSADNVRQAAEGLAKAVREAL